MDESILELIVIEQTGKLSDDQKTQLNSWRLESEQNEAAYLSTLQLWKDAGQVAYHSQDHKARDWEVVSEVINSQQPTSKNWMLRVAASVTALLVAGFLTYQIYLSPYAGYTAYESDSQIEEVVLIDGSTITLNKDSKLWVSGDFNVIDRAVKLEGEAYFEVAKNDQVPFEISGGESVTKVVGTSFNLRVENTSVALTVTEGRVSFGTSSETIPVGAGESANLKADQQPTLIEHNLNRLSWKTGGLKFDDTPLRQVCRDIGSHYDIDINIAEEAANLRFTSQYDSAPLEEVLNELELILALDIRLNNTTYQVNLK
ncbi:MAG: FecR domain-containing protein [Cyclobacteriaceae bacterium]